MKFFLSTFTLLLVLSACGNKQASSSPLDGNGENNEVVKINENKEAIIPCSFLQHGMQDGKKIAPSQKYKVKDFETIINIDGL